MIQTGAPADEPMQHSSRVPRAGLRVLVVDDDPMDRHMVRHTMLRSGLAASVDEARTSDEAFSAIGAGATYDCILLDYNLPGADGMTVLRRMLTVAPNVPVVMLTGQGDEQVAVALMKAGAVDYLPKSAATPERIAASVRYAMELARATELAHRAHVELQEIAARATAAAQRTAHLQRITAALADASSVDAVSNVIAREAILSLGASAGGVALRTGDELELVTSVGYPETADMSPGRRWLLTAPIPIADTARAGLPVFLESPEEWAQQYGGGHADARPESLTGKSWAALPLKLTIKSAKDGAQGAIFWAFDEPRTFSSEDRSLFTAVGQQCTQAMERARLREAEHAARAEAENANKAKADFLARMSHDLRTPLNAIAGFTELVLLGIHGPVTDQQREALERVQRAQQHLLTLINDILSFARLEAGQVSLTMEAVPVAQALQQVGALVEPQARAKGLVLHSAGGPENAMVRADPQRLQQVLLNLAVNAVKFTERGSVALGWSAGPSTVRIFVRDTGPGIAAEKLTNIFEPFVQGSNEMFARSDGVGLGLAIGRELSRMMGGTLTVESALGAGSNFVLELERA